MIKTPREHCSGQTAREIHLALKSALKTMADAEKSAVICFGEIMARRLYRELGYGSINHYAEVELGFSTSRTRDFIALTKRLARLPLLKEKVASGKLGYTAARVIAPVVDQSNEQEWVEFAATHTRRELEQEVKCAKQQLAESAARQAPLLPTRQERPVAVMPVRVTLEMTPAQFSRYEALWEKIRGRRGTSADKIEAMLEIMQSFADAKGPRGPQPRTVAPPVQIHVHKCSECDKATVQTGRGELEIGVAELSQAECDCQISHPGERNKTSIPPAARRRVLANARHKCQRPGCDHTRHLQVHHRVPRSRGGTNQANNLLCLCGACHALVHRQPGSGASWAKSPQPRYKWAFPTG